jgi:hypothetical protein
MTKLESQERRLGSRRDLNATAGKRPSLVVIRQSDFVIRHPEIEQDSDAQFPITLRSTNMTHDTSTHHDTSICFLIPDGNAL